MEIKLKIKSGDLVFNASIALVEKLNVDERTWLYTKNGEKWLMKKFNRDTKDLCDFKIKSIKEIVNVEIKQ